MKKLVLFLSLLALANNSEAQVYECDGVFRNLPCDQAAPADKAPSIASTTSDREKKELSLKKSVIHDISMKAIDANRDYKIYYDTEVIREFCMRPETTSIDCSARAQELGEKIDNRIASLETINAQKKANELAETKIKENLDEKNVTIVNQPIYIGDPTPFPRPPGHWPRPPVYRPPYQRPPSIPIRPKPIINNKKAVSPTTGQPLP